MKPLDIQKIRDFFATQPIDKAWLFGSYARGEENENSDVDILVSFDKMAEISLLKHADMIIQLEDLLSLPVDLVRDTTIYPEVDTQISNDKILIYDRQTSYFDAWLLSDIC